VGASYVLLLGASFAEPGSALALGLQEATGRPVRARGLRGATLDEWLADALSRPEELQQAHAVYVVELGGNGVPSPQAARRAHQQLLQLASGPVRWAPVPTWPLDNRTRERRARTQRALHEAGVPFAGGPVQLAPGDVAPDGVHLRTPALHRMGARLPRTSWVPQALAGGLLVAAGVFVGLAVSEG